MAEAAEFLNIYRQGLARIAAATPRVHVGDPAANLAATLEMARAAHEAGAALCVFPELGLTGYAIDDLLQQEVGLDGAEAALAALLDASAALRPLLLVGLPLRVRGRLGNVAAAGQGGRLLGLVPKT